MKILHSADWHVGESKNIIPDYLARQRRCVKGIFKIAEREKCDVVVIAGDLFHPFRKVQDGTLWYEVYSAEKDMLLECLLAADQVGYQILIINGNHDLVHDKVTLLHYLTLLVEKGKLKNVTIAELEPKLIKIQDVNFGLIPYSHTMDSAATIKGWSDVENLVCVGHEWLAGATTDSNYSSAKGARLPIQDNVLAYMWGDVHKRQKIQGLSHARYCGSPLQHNFGDEPDKGVIIWDDFKPKFVRIPSKELVTVKEGEEIPTDKYVRMLTSRCDAQLPDNCVKVELAFAETDAVVMDDDDVWFGLTEQLAAQGLSAEQQNAAIELAKGLTK